MYCSTIHVLVSWSKFKRVEKKEKNILSKTYVQNPEYAYMYPGGKKKNLLEEKANFFFPNNTLTTLKAFSV